MSRAIWLVLGALVAGCPHAGPAPAAAPAPTGAAGAVWKVETTPAASGGDGQRSHRGKPTVAILGLEVLTDDGAADAKAVEFAAQLTDGLRMRPRSGTGRFSVSPGSDKDLQETRFLGGCDGEANSCMARIGADLGADFLLFGKVEKSRDGYQVSLKLLDVGTATTERSTSDVVPWSDTVGVALNAASKTLYNKITDARSIGALVVIADVEDGALLLDGAEKGALSAGRARLDGLDAGVYELSIRTACDVLVDHRITVEAGMETTVTVELGAAARDCAR